MWSGRSYPCSAQHDNPRARAIAMLYLILAMAALTALIIVIGAIGELFKDGLWVFLWRWFSGHNLHGHYYTDATWFHKGRIVKHPTRRVIYWHHLPRVHRASIRMTSTLLPVFIIYGLVTDFAATVLAIEIAAGIGLSALGYMGYRKTRRIIRHRRTVNPLASALSPLLRLPEIECEKALSLVPNHHKVREGKVGELTLPDHFQTGNEIVKTDVENLFNSRLATDVDFDWKTRGTRGIKLVMIAAPKPPTMVPFEQYIDAMEACAPNEVVIGLDRHRKVFTASFNLDDPHWGFSCGSGMGKTTFLLCTTAQILHNDANATADVIDPKQSGFDEFQGIPGFRVACDPLDAAEMWALVESVYDEMMQRQSIRKRDKTVEFPAKIFLIDEANTFADIMRDHWQDLKREMKNPPTGAPPVWRKIARILWMGRETNIHVVIVGQKLDDKSVGGIGLRDSLGFRGLAGFKPGMWKILIGTTPVPRSQKQKGRWIYSDGQTETWVQNLYADTEFLRDYAMQRRAIETTGTIPHDMPVTDYDSANLSCDALTTDEIFHPHIISETGSE